MKTKASLLALAAFALVFTSCNENEGTDELVQESPVELLRVAGNGTSTFILENVCPVLSVTDPLTADEIEFLNIVREEEKLSRDLYNYFASQYPTALPLTNIGNAETNHIAAIERVLTYYEIEFPALGQPGVFTDKDRQDTYDRLKTEGSTLAAAYQIMAFIEEENIVTYRKVAGELTNINLQVIITNLGLGSENHFRTLVKQITALGGTFKPTLMNDTQYNEIINASNHHGTYYCKQGQQGQNTNNGKGKNHHGNKGHVNNCGTCTYCLNATTTGQGHNKGHGGKR
ncbi:DUF2202 domain-containing protein [Parabacteroides sp. PF5-6]|uniref:DUF2202 domain-containing protein n=1 Tax=Parabacteroides sp. PF5-6 TaxID=1742403 RepID=UPI002405327B|nr:DUF2202 domain-containing protein [Parabacteroides sp. PF5-6]MDF9829698.1 hypothetical protein [Parabacteroides sp. PF5-6]